MPVSGGEYLEKCDHDLEDDQERDEELEPQRAPCIDDIGQDLGGLGDHAKLAVERLDPFLELVFVLEPGIEPLQIGPPGGI